MRIKNESNDIIPEAFATSAKVEYLEVVVVAVVSCTCSDAVCLHRSESRLTPVLRLSQVGGFRLGGSVSTSIDRRVLVGSSAFRAVVVQLAHVTLLLLSLHIKDCTVPVAWFFCAPIPIAILVNRSDAELYRKPTVTSVFSSSGCFRGDISGYVFFQLNSKKNKTK